MLETKIQELIDSKEIITLAIVSGYIANLNVYGKQDATLAITVDMLLSFLSLKYLGYNIRLALYKKIITLLQRNNINYTI